MTMHLSPQDEQLIQERLATGAFASAEEVVHRALQYFEAEEPSNDYTGFIR